MHVLRATVLTCDCREPEKVFEGIEIEPALKESLLLNIKRRMTPKGTWQHPYACLQMAAQ